MKAEVTLEQALELLMEDQPVPPLVVTGIFANTEDLKDGNGEMQVIELQVKE